MNVESKCGLKTRARRRAFTLTEVVISTAIAALTIAGIMYGYVMSARRAEWSGYSLAAHSAAVQMLERTRAAKWDPAADPVVDKLVATEFPDEVVLMDLPVVGTNAVYATNKITITTVSTNPPVKMIRVDCTWKLSGTKVYTNTIVAYRSPQT